MEQNVILWLKSAYDILIGKDSMKFLSFTTTPTPTTTTTTTANDSSSLFINDNDEKEIDQKQQQQQQQQQQTDMIDMNNNNGKNNEQRQNKNHYYIDEIHSNQSIESYHSIQQQQQQQCDSKQEERTQRTIQQQQQQQNNQTLNLIWSKFCSKQPSPSLRSNQFIQTMIDAYRRYLPDHCNPLKINDIRDHRLNPFVTIRTRQYRIYGLGNVTKTAEDGFIKFLGNHRFIIDFIILINDLKIQLDCQLKLGHRWQKKRLSLRNKHYEMDLTKCRLYVELIIDTSLFCFISILLMIVSNELDSQIDSSNNNNNNNTIGNDQQNSISNNSSATLIINQNIQQIFADRIRLAAKRIQTGDYNGAIRLYSEALKLDHSNHIVYGNRSAVYCRLGRYEKALNDAIKARELCPNWSKAYYRQGIALQFLRRYPDALAAFASGLAQESKSTQLLSAFVETAMKSPLRATLEPIYRQLQVMNFDKSPFVITSVVGQELLAASHYAAAVVVLESALQIGSCSLKLRGSVFSALSTAYWTLNDLDHAIDYMQQDYSYKEALASHRYQLVLAMKHKHSEQAALALTSLGHVYSAIGDLKNALSSHQQCLQIIRQLGGDPLAEAREIGNVGSVHLAAGAFEKAIECHLEHVKLAKLLGNKTEEARAYSNLGSAYHYRRQYEQAIQFHEQVLRISQEIGDRTIESKAYAGLGHASRCMKDYIQAKRWYERQLDAALNTKDRTAEAKACSNLGIVYQLLGDLDGALKLHWSHLNICKQLNDHAGIGRAYGNIGNTNLVMKKPEEALKYHKMELQISKQIHDRVAEAATHGSIALCYQSLSLLDQSSIHLNLHLNIAREINDIQCEAQALCNLGNFHQSNRCYEKAIYYYEHYLRTTQTIDDKDGQTNASHYLGVANLSLKRYQLALEYFQFDLNQSKQLQDRDYICRAYCHLGLVHQAMGNLDDALECHKYYLCLVQDDHDGRLKAMGYIGDLLAQQGKHMEAIKILEKKLSLSRSANDIVNEAMTLQSMGNCHRIVGDWERASDFFKQESILRQQQCLPIDIKEEIRSLNDLALHNVATTRFHMNHYEESAIYYEQESTLIQETIEQFEKNKNHTIIAMVSNDETAADETNDSNNNNTTANNNNNNTNGRTEIIATIIDDLIVRNVNCLRSIGDCHFAQRRYDEAIKFYTDFVSTSKSLIDQEHVYCLLGKCYQLVNNLQQALVSYEKRLVIAHEIGCDQTKAMAYGELGHLHRLLGNYEQAITCFKHEQELGKKNHKQQQNDHDKQIVGPINIGLLIEAEALHGLGCVAQEMHDYERSLKYHSSALAIAQEIGSLEMESRAYGAIGSAYNALGNHESAIRYQEKYLSVAQMIGDLNAQVSALSALGKINSSNSNYQQARRYFQQALSIVENQNNQNRIGYRDEEEARICYELGMVLWAMNELEVAETHLRRSVDLIENLQNLNSSITQLMIAPMMMISNSLISNHYGFRAFSITSIEQIVDMARSQNAAILYYSMTIDGRYNSWLITPEQVHFASLLKSDREKILQLIKNVQNSLFVQESNVHDPPHTTTANRSIDSTIIADHDDYPDTSFELDHESLSSSQLAGKMKRSASYRYLNRNWQGFSAATALYDILIGPFQNQLDQNESTINQLLLVLDGDLFLVPWNMLRNKDEEFLSERYSLLVIPSLHVLRGDQNTKTLRKKSDDSHSTITSLVVANPTMPNKLSSITTTTNGSGIASRFGHNFHNHRPQLYFENPASSKEAAFVSELLSTRPLIGTEANKEAVLAQLSTAQCIHFSSYIIDNTDGDPLKMATGLGIAISPSDVLIVLAFHPNWFPAISSRSTNHAAALNAATTYNSSQVLKTITSALLQAGAACVLLTLWPVSLSALQVLFRIFYCSLLQGTRVSTALKEAVSTIQNTTHFSHPRNWAGFILIGSDVRLSSQVALMSSSLATMIKTPEKSRDAMRVVLHLVEKSLQRIQRGQKNAMYTTVQSIENKVGINTQGWRELLIAVGFRFEPSSTNGLPACVFFPQSDPNGLGADSVTLRAGKNANFRTIMFTLQSLQALFDNENRETIDNDQLQQQQQQQQRTSATTNNLNENDSKSPDECNIHTRQSSLSTIISSHNSIASSSIIAESSPGSRGFSIGRNPLDVELIEMKLKSMMPNTNNNTIRTEDHSQSTTSSQSSIATSNTVLNRQLSSYT
ncbi:Tetratricopeptide repeat protein 28 [Dermatophagoides farinae]|uniref:Tetratricopeptide repeat protein 28 n=1 Tax=Dermatophagoides farinae TaxID=6954 RepID=A0A922KZY5_DERFA|nr:Tetratricopeptide repeat protein 28 [Dermatophagoides farinae]